MSEVLTPKELQAKADQTAVMQLKVAEQAKALKEAQKEIDDTWKQVEAVMIEHDVKSIKGEWGSITIAEKPVYRAEDADLSGVPPKFIKKALDTSKISNYHKLENKLPKGVTSTTTKYLTKRIK